MPTDNSLNEFENPDGSKKLPGSLNVLTILTFIGCAFGLLWTAAAPFFFKFFGGMMEKAASNPDVTAKQLEEMQKGRASMEIMQANIVPIVITGLAGIILCFVGALWMRKLKKDGYWLYLGGQILPLAAGLIILGTSQITGVMSVLLGYGIPVLFIVLYTLQRKYLVN